MHGKTKGLIHTISAMALVVLISAAWSAAAVTLVTSTTSCTKNTRGDTIRASVAALNAARDHYVSWDRERQLEIVKECPDRTCYETRVAEHRKRLEAMTQLFVTAYEYLVRAATDDDDTSLRRAVAASGKIVSVIKNLLPTDAHPPVPDLGGP